MSKKNESHQVNDGCPVGINTADQKLNEKMRRPSPPTVSGKVLFTDEHIPNQTTKLLVDAE